MARALRRRWWIGESERLNRSGTRSWNGRTKKGETSEKGKSLLSLIANGTAAHARCATRRKGEKPAGVVPTEKARARGMREISPGEERERRNTLCFSLVAACRCARTFKHRRRQMGPRGKLVRRNRIPCARFSGARMFSCRLALSSVASHRDAFSIERPTGPSDCMTNINVIARIFSEAIAIVSRCGCHFYRES